MGAHELHNIYIYRERERGKKQKHAKRLYSFPHLHVFVLSPIHYALCSSTIGFKCRAAHPPSHPPSPRFSCPSNKSQAWPPTCILRYHPSHNVSTHTTTPGKGSGCCRFFMSTEIVVILFCQGWGPPCFVKLNEKQGNLCGFMVTACFDPVVCSLFGCVFMASMEDWVSPQFLGKLSWLLDLKHLKLEILSIIYLQGGFNPFEKTLVKFDHFPR